MNHHLKSPDLGGSAVGRLVLRIALPSMLGQFVSVLYSIVDRMYIGHIENGDLALAGVGVCGPILTMLASFAFLVGIGGAPLMSMRMGEGKHKEAAGILSVSFLMLCALSVILPLAVFPLKKPMLLLFGAGKGTTYPYADRYFTVYLTGTGFALLSSGMNQFIISQGYAKTGMCATMLGALMNILLDPLFLFIFHMGVEGAALATVFSQMISCIFVLIVLFSRRISVPLQLGKFSPRMAVKILSIGFTPFFIIALDNLMIILLNAVLSAYGGIQGDLLITAATIVQSFMLVVTMPLGGITGGTQTILSYNYGAGRPNRVLKAQRYIFGLCLLYVSLMLLLARAAGGRFIALFTDDAEIAALANWGIRVSTLALLPLGIQYEIVDGFTALGKVGISLPLSLLRKIVYFISIFVLPIFFGATATFYAEPICDLLGPALSIIIYLTCIRRSVGADRR